MTEIKPTRKGMHVTKHLAAPIERTVSAADMPDTKGGFHGACVITRLPFDYELALTGGRTMVVVETHFANGDLETVCCEDRLAMTHAVLAAVERVVPPAFGTAPETRIQPLCP